MPKTRTERVPVPPSGSVFVFPATGTLNGACRVLRSGDGRCLVALTEWIGDNDPSVQTPSVQRIQRLTHHNLQSKLAVTNAVEGPPGEFRLIGQIEPTQEEALLVTDSYGAWGWIAAQRKLQTDADEASPVASAPRAAVPGVRAVLSLEEIRQVAFARRWRGHVPEEAIRKTVEIIQTTVDALQSLGSKPEARATRKIIRDGVQRFNDLERRHGFIETIEREDIGESFNAMAEACGLKVDDVTAPWREW